MAIYRPPKPRWPLALAVGAAGLLVGLGAGLVAGNSEPSASEIAEDVRAGLIAAAGSLEVAEIEYEESVSDGEIVAEPEYRGALAAIGSSETRYREVAPTIEALAPARAEEIAALYDECSEQMGERVPAEQVTRCLVRLTALLEGDD